MSMKKGCVMHPFFMLTINCLTLAKSDKKPVLQFLHCRRETLFFLLKGV